MPLAAQPGKHSSAHAAAVKKCDDDYWQAVKVANQDYLLAVRSANGQTGKSKAESFAHARKVKATRWQWRKYARPSV